VLDSGVSEAQRDIGAAAGGVLVGEHAQGVGDHVGVARGAGDPDGQQQVAVRGRVEARVEAEPARELGGPGRVAQQPGPGGGTVPAGVDQGDGLVEGDAGVPLAQRPAAGAVVEAAQRRELLFEHAYVLRGHVVAAPARR
jgi:hypothetical protein